MSTKAKANKKAKKKKNSDTLAWIGPKAGLKRGRLSREEDKRIATLLNEGMAVEDIATEMSRPLSQIENHVKKFYGKGTDVSPDAPRVAEFTRILRKSVHWSKLQEHYSKEELEYYEVIYASLMSQFQEDVTAIDELQILQAIDGHMLINYHKKRTSDTNKLLLNISREISYLEMSDDPDDKAKLMNLESQRQVLTSQVNHSVKVFTDLSKKFDETVAKLKGARDQRLKNAENSHQSWPALIKHMQQTKVKEREGRYAAMVKFATDKKLDELQQPYKYINNEIDQPILLPERVLVGMPEELDLDLGGNKNVVENNQV